MFHEQIEHWGERLLTDRVAPSAADDPQLRASFARLEAARRRPRHGAGPASSAA